MSSASARKRKKPDRRPMTRVSIGVGGGKAAGKVESKVLDVTNPGPRSLPLVPLDAGNVLDVAVNVQGISTTMKPLTDAQ